ncbi:MAG: hemerythrin domain-containing protein [Hasllibacter sp.]
MDLSLENRDGLPDALRVLLADHPREGWRAHPEFGPLTRFWLERHLGFRRLLGMLRADARAALDGAAPDRARLSRLGGTFLNELHGHHSIEDHHYFPRLAALAPELERGFALLDADHHRLHDELAAFARGANAVLRAPDPRDPLGRFEADLTRMDRFLDRHLTDEEELVVPVILRAGEAALD